MADALGLDLIPCVARTAINRDAFIAALCIGLPEAMKQFPGRYPVLHVSAHGGPDGIQLSSGDILTWADLREYLVPINASLQGALLLCMSACEGYSACRMAMEEGNAPQPYFAMIGNYGSPTWSDTAVAYLAFYHLLAKGWTLHNATEAMKAASGDEKWGYQTAEQAKRGYIEYLKSRVKPEAAQQDLENAAQRESLPADAKAFEQTGSE